MTLASSEFVPLHEGVELVQDFDDDPPPRAQMEHATSLNGTIYTYVLKSHFNVAPCDQHNLPTLALCKPKIRERIGEKNGIGDVLVGMWQSQHNQTQQCTHYIAIASTIVPLEEYYADDSKYRSRHDCIYVMCDGAMKHLGGRFHNGNVNRTTNVAAQLKDGRGVVLICEKYHFCQYNDTPEATYMSSYLAQGHRYNDDDTTKAFVANLFTKEGLLTADEGAASGTDNTDSVAADQTMTTTAHASAPSGAGNDDGGNQQRKFLETMSRALQLYICRIDSDFFNPSKRKAPNAGDKQAGGQDGASWVVGRCATCIERQRERRREACYDQDDHRRHTSNQQRRPERRRGRRQRTDDYLQAAPGARPVLGTVGPHRPRTARVGAGLR